MFRRLLPQETSFYDFFEAHSKLTIQACRELHAMASNPTELAARTSRIKEIELEADDITHKCVDALHRTFITPIDRADIHQLITRLDDITDSLNSAASRLMLYELTEMRPETIQFADILVKSTTAIETAVHGLRKIQRSAEAIEKSCTVIYDAEREADQVLRSALGRLFGEEHDPLLVIKWKEIFERLEKATDRCQQVAILIEGVVIEAS